MSVPLIFTLWGTFFWFAGGRRMLRDPRRVIREIAEFRAQSRWLPGDDVGEHFEGEWRLRWVWVVVAVLYVLCVAGAWIHVLVC